MTPSQGINEASFMVRVRDHSRLDYESLREINFTLVAREVGVEAVYRITVVIGGS